MEHMADKIAFKVAKILKVNNSVSKARESTEGSKTGGIMSKAANLEQFLLEFPDFQVISENKCHILRCSTCLAYITYSGSSGRLPLGNGNGSLAFGLLVDDTLFNELCIGHCDAW